MKKPIRIFLKTIKTILTLVIAVPLICASFFFWSSYLHLNYLMTNSVILSDDDYSALYENSFEGINGSILASCSDYQALNQSVKSKHADELFTGRTYYYMFSAFLFAGEAFNTRNPYGNVTFTDGSVEICDSQIYLIDIRRSGWETFTNRNYGDLQDIQTSCQADGNRVNFSLETKVTFINMLVIVKFTPVTEGLIDVRSDVYFDYNVFADVKQSTSYAECNAYSYFFEGLSITDAQTQYRPYGGNFESTEPTDANALNAGTDYYAIISFNLKTLKDFDETTKIAVVAVYNATFSPTLYKTDSADFTQSGNKITVYYTVPLKAETEKHIQIILRITPAISGGYGCFITVSSDSLAGECSIYQNVTVN